MSKEMSREDISKLSREEIVREMSISKRDTLLEYGKKWGALVLLLVFFFYLIS